MTYDPDFSISPSRLARAFELSCDRRLRLSLTKPDRLPELWRGVLVESRRAEEESSTTQGIFQSGHDWEARALTTLVSPSILIAPPGDEPLSQRKWRGAEESLSVLAEAKAGQLLYQLELSPPVSFYQQLGLDPKQVSISHNFPDLVQVLTEDEVESVARDPQRAEAWLRGSGASAAA